MNIRKKHIDKLIKERNRLYKRARNEYDEAKELFQVGSLDFADSLQLANQHYGAAEAIAYTLKSIGYVETKKRCLSAREKRLLKAWVKQKSCALFFIILVLLSIFTHVATFSICGLAGIGFYLLFTNKKWFRFITAK